MKVPDFHIPSTLEEAEKIQKEVKEKIVLSPLSIDKIEYIAGGDAIYREGRSYSCIVLFTYPEMEIKEIRFGEERVKFPYAPGYFSFREIPPLLIALKKISRKPDVLVLDAHGIAHPKRCGLASHLGVLLGMPTVGCAKNLLVGDYPSLPMKEGSWVYLKKGKEVLGIVLRSRENTSPIFISPGHLTDVESALQIILKTLKGYRIPEIIRLPHLYLRSLPQKSSFS